MGWDTSVSDGDIITAIAAVMASSGETMLLWWWHLVRQDPTNLYHHADYEVHGQFYTIIQKLVNWIRHEFRCGAFNVQVKVQYYFHPNRRGSGQE